MLSFFAKIVQMLDRPFSPYFDNFESPIQGLVYVSINAV